MVLSDITNAHAQRSSEKLDTSVLAEKLHTKALQQENLLLKAEIEGLRAAADAAEPRTPRNRQKQPERPRTVNPRAAHPSRTNPRAADTEDRPGTAGASRTAGARGGRPGAISPRSEATGGERPRPATHPRIRPGASPREASKPKVVTGARAGWAHALKEERRRAEEASASLARTRQRRQEQQAQLEEASRRAAGLQQELTEAMAGHPERIQSLHDSAEGAAEGLQLAQMALQQEEQQMELLRQKVAKEKVMLEELQGELRSRQAHALHERSLRAKHMRREEALREAIEGARQEQEAVKALLAESGLVLQKMNNEILNLKGNVRVFCRLRPRLPQETQEELRTEVVEQQLTVFGLPQLNVTGLNEQTRSWSFDFDHIFRPGDSQADVFEEIALLVQSALDGYRVAILAYGQTGSGKTHTMLGPEEGEDPGVLPRTAELIFKEVEQLKKNGWEFEVSAGLAEVYNDSVVELGTAKGSEESRSELNRRPVRDAAAMHQLLKRASRERHVASTSANERSSRSHAVIQLALVGRCVIPGMQREVSGLLSFVDLAGSERLAHTSATGDRLKEAQHINRSLCALGDVIEAICRKGALSKGGTPSAASSVHVPFRNSRLTMLLRDSLGGDSKTLMFVNVSPFQEHLGETLSSLRFASKVHACCIGLAKRHVVEGSDESR